MYGKKVKLRFFFVLLVLITLILSIFLILKSLEENVVYFQSPSEIQLLEEIEKKKKKQEKEETKKLRKSIPKSLKILVWDKNIGKEKGIGGCDVCKSEIDSKNFEGGTIDLRIKNDIISMRPGLTGWSQISAYDNMSDEEKGIIFRSVFG